MEPEGTETYGRGGGGEGLEGKSLRAPGGRKRGAAGGVDSLKSRKGQRTKIRRTEGGRRRAVEKEKRGFGEGEEFFIAEREYASCGDRRKSNTQKGRNEHGKRQKGNPKISNLTMSQKHIITSRAANTFAS